MSQFELFELVLLLKLGKQLPVEQFKATVSQLTVLTTRIHPPPLSRPQYDTFSGAVQIDRPYAALIISRTGGSVAGVGVAMLVLKYSPHLFTPRRSRSCNARCSSGPSSEFVRAALVQIETDASGRAQPHMCVYIHVCIQTYIYIYIYIYAQPHPLYSRGSRVGNPHRGGRARCSYLPWERD